MVDKVAVKEYVANKIGEQYIIPTLAVYDSADDIRENFYDMDFQPINFSHGRKLYEKPISKPEQFDKMKEVAQVLAEDVPNVRIDFFLVNGNLYFSEYTFYDWAGYARIYPESWDMKLGALMKLP